MVYMYGVVMVAGKATCSSWARSISFSIRNWALTLPRASTTASKLSTHSAVSSGSMSGSWREKPSKITPHARAVPRRGRSDQRGRGADARPGEAAQAPAYGWAHRGRGDARGGKRQPPEAPGARGRYPVEADGHGHAREQHKEADRASPLRWGARGDVAGGRPADERRRRGEALAGAGQRRLEGGHAARERSGG